MAVRPSRLTTDMLRRAAGGRVEVRSGRPRPADEPKLHYAYETGDVVLDAKGYALSTRAFCRIVKAGWLLPVEVGVYRARAIPDGPAPTQDDEEDMAREHLPTTQQTAILRRASLHRIVVSFIEGRRVYEYGDGVPVNRKDAERLIARGWVRPETPGLFRDEPQSYVVPR